MLHLTPEQFGKYTPRDYVLANKGREKVRAEEYERFRMSTYIMATSLGGHKGPFERWLKPLDEEIKNAPRAKIRHGVKSSDW